MKCLNSLLKKPKFVVEKLSAVLLVKESLSAVEKLNWTKKISNRAVIEKFYERIGKPKGASFEALWDSDSEFESKVWILKVLICNLYTC